VSMTESIERLRYALKMHDEHRTTIQSLASSVGEFLRDHARHIAATPQPPKPADLCANCAADGRCMKRQALCVANGTADAKHAGAVPLPVMEVLERREVTPLCDHVVMGYTAAQLEAYGDAREAAGRADAVPALDSVLRERGLPTVADALGYSRNFAAANPALSQTTRDHIEGLCNMLEIAANHPAPATPQMTTQGEAVDPWATIIALCEALDIDPETARSAPGKPSDVILEAARKKFTGPQP